MARVPIALPTGSNPTRYGHEGNARLINTYAESLGRDAKADVALYASDGLASFSTLTGGGGVRCIMPLSDSDCLVVAGRVVFRVDGLGTSTIIGGLASDGMVTAARNRVGQVAFVCDGLYYGYTGGSFDRLADPDLPPPISVSHIDGYFIFLLADGRFFWSTIDGWDVDALSTATAEANPDGGVRSITRGRDLVLCGTRSTEFWSNTGAESPFARTTANDIGCLAADAVVELEQTIYMVAHDGTVRRLNGYQWETISTHPVERFIADETDKAGLTACSWQARGHSWYALSGTTGTWAYDAKTGSWIERQSYGLDRWRVAHTAQFGSKIVAGDYATGLLYDMRPETYDEAGTELVCTIQPAPVHAGGLRAFHARLDLDVVPGVGQVIADGADQTTGGTEGASLFWWLPYWRTAFSGTTTIPGTSYDHLRNPTLMLDYSDDGGATFGAERTLAMGAAGQRLRRCFATRLGQSRSRTYRVRISAAVARGVVSMALTQSVGAS